MRVILFAIIAALALTTGAHAQGPIVRKIQADIQKRASTPAATADPITTLMADIEKVKADVVTGLVAALQEADDDAGTVVNATTQEVRDPISHACYPAQIKFLQSLPSVKPITSGAPYNLIVLFQRKRDFVAQLKAGLPAYLKVGCAALIGDEVKIFISTLAMAGVKVALGGATALFPAAAPFTLPALGIIP